MLYSKNFFLIGSADRNVGKTEFACNLISQTLKTCKQVIGVKVTTVKDDSQHACPRGGEGCGACASLLDNFCLTCETNFDTSKDTSRMLRAGANAVYWLRVRSSALNEGASALLETIKTSHGSETPVVCESNTLRTLLEPGLFFVLNRFGNLNTKSSYKAVEHLADKKVTLLSIDKGFDFDLNKISFKNNRWYFKTDASCIILAGGKSSRMGEDKTKLMINGLTMIENSVKLFSPIFSEIIISSNVPDNFPNLNLPVIKDISKNSGPLMGIYSCLKVSQSEQNFVTACDIPEPNISLIYKMLSISSSYDAVIPRCKDATIEPLFAVYNKRTLYVIGESLKSSRQIRAFFNKVKVNYVETNSCLLNINTYSDYKTFIDKQKNGDKS